VVLDATPRMVRRVRVVPAPKSEPTTPPE
jgi:hypothetical protein